MLTYKTPTKRYHYYYKDLCVLLLLSVCIPSLPASFHSIYPKSYDDGKIP